MDKVQKLNDPNFIYHRQNRIVSKIRKTCSLDYTNIKEAFFYTTSRSMKSAGNQGNKRGNSDHRGNSDAQGHSCIVEIWGDCCNIVVQGYSCKNMTKHDTHRQTWMVLYGVISYSVLEIGRYVPAYRTRTSFVRELHTGIYQYILYPFIFFFHFSGGILFSILRNIPALLNFHFEHCLR
jgi:hypothetical protein